MALGGLALAFRHWRRPVTASASDADAELVEAALAEHHEGGGTA